MPLSDVNIKVDLAKWLQRHPFDAEYTIRQLQLTTNMPKMVVVEKTGNICLA